MALPTCAVSAYVYKQDGTPDVGARVVAVLNRFDVDDVENGYVGPIEAEVIVDELGHGVLNLWPNQRGSTESSYRVRIEGPERSFTLTAVVPEQTAVNLDDIATLPPFPGKPDGQAAMEQAIASAAEAAASAANALGSEQAAATSAQESADSAQASEGSAQAADSAAQAAAGSASAAAGSASSAAASEATALATLPITSATPPVDVLDGVEWIHPDTGKRYTWFEDAGGGQWVEMYVTDVIDNPGAALSLKAELGDDVDLAKGAAMVGYNEYQTVRDKLDDVVTFEQFGAGKGDDDSALTRLVEWLNARNFGCVVRMDGSYTFTQVCPVTLTCPGVLFGGRGKLDLTGLPLVDDTYLIQAQGPGFTGAETTLTADWITQTTRNPNGEGLTVKVTSTAGFNAGDYVTITSTQYYGGAGLGGFRTVGTGRIRQIRAVIDGTTLALDQGPNGPAFDATTYTVNVRSLRLMDRLSVHDLTIVGPYTAIGSEATDVAGTGFLRGQYIHAYSENGLSIRGFQGPATQIEMSDVMTIRDASYKCVWAGNRSYSVRRPSYLNIDFENGRRPYDYDCLYRPWGTDTNEEVQTELVQVMGGMSRNAESGIGGHIAHYVSATGVAVKDCRIGFHNRGMHNTIVGCDLDAYDKGVVLGLGSSALEDVSSYDYPVNTGETYIDSTTQIRAKSRGIHVTGSWDKFVCDAYIEADNALMAFGKKLSNARITANFKGTNPAATYGGYCIGLGATLPDEANNIRIQGGTISDTNRAVWHLGAQSEISNFQVDGVHFDNVNTYYVRAEAASEFDLDTCYVTNCTHSGAVASSPIGGLLGTRPILWESGNSWPRGQDIADIVSGAVEITSGADSVLTYVAPASSSTVTSLSSGKRGQVVMLRNAGPGTLSITHSTNLRLSGAASLSAAGPGSVITFVCVNSTGTQWAEVSRQIAP